MREIKLSDGSTRFVTNPVVGEEYWLGYKNNGGFCSYGEEIKAIYFGRSDEKYLFLNLNEKGQVEMYACHFPECLLHFFGGGEDEPCIPAINAPFEGIMEGSKHEIDFAKQRILGIRAKKSLEKEVDSVQLV